MNGVRHDWSPIFPSSRYRMISEEIDMRISSSTLCPTPAPAQSGPPRFKKQMDAITDFYEANQTGINLASGALIYSGIASAATGDPLAVLAGGLLGGVLGGSCASQKAVGYTAAGLIVGAAVGHLAGLGAIATCAAAGAGSVVGRLVALPPEAWV